MGLTGCPDPAAPPARSAERVEALALMWHVLDGDEAYCANPRLLMITRILPELRRHRAAALLDGVRRGTGRDALVKGLVGDAHGRPVPEPMADLAAALDEVSAGWEALAGALGEPLKAAYREMRHRADPFAAGLNPAADLAAITGEHDPFEAVVVPSLFLPPPQSGRHSVAIDGFDGRAITYLHYGFPLDADPSRFGISRAWLTGGAWHHAVSRFLARHWPPVAAELRSMPEVEAALTAALAPHRGQVQWPRILAEHVGVALKGLLCARAGLPETVHGDFARAQGLAFFGWFRPWLDGIAGSRDAFVHRFEGMAQAIRARQDELILAAEAVPGAPDTLNFALASHQPRRPVLVVPDHWDGALLARIRLRWSRVTATLLRESEWRAAAGDPASSVLVFGQVGRDAAVDAVLAQRGLGFERSPAGGDVLVSLVPTAGAGRSWTIAVAVHDPAVLGDFSADHVMGAFHRTARFAGSRLVDGDGAGAA